MKKSQTSFEYLLLIGGVLIFVLLVINVGVSLSNKSSSQASSSDVNNNNFQNWKLNCYNFGTIDKNYTVAYYPFDTDYKDQSGNKIDLTAYGNPFISSGHIKKAVKFSAITDGINNTPKGPSFDFYNSTLTLWFNTSTATGYIVKHYSGSTGWILGVNSGQLRFWINGAWTGLGVTVNDNAWHYAAITQNSSGYYSWVDGIAYGYFAAPAFATDTTDFIIGKGGSDNGIIGSVDDVRFYNRSISNLEALQDMNCTTVTS